MTDSAQQKADRPAPRPLAVHLLAALILGVTTLLLMVVVDRALGLLGYPPGIPIQVTHPANFSEQRQSPEFSYHFETNDQGLRYPSIPLEKPANEQRVLMLGDSFTEGDGVEHDQTFGALLERRFESNPGGKTVRFINGGLSGTGPLQYLRLFREVGLAYQPDTVLVAVMANDVENTPTRLSDTDLQRRYEFEPADGLAGLVYALFPHSFTIVSRARRQEHADSVSKLSVFDKVADLAKKRGISDEAVAKWRAGIPPEIWEDAEHINIGRLAFSLLRPNYLVNNLDLADAEARESFASMLKVMDAIVELAAQRGIRVGVLYVPFDFQYDPRRYSNWDLWIDNGMLADERWLTDNGEAQTRLAAWARERNVPFLDLTPACRSAVTAPNSEAITYPLDVHWKPAGHRVAAEAILPWLEETGLVSVPPAPATP